MTRMDAEKGVDIPPHSIYIARDREARQGEVGLVIDNEYFAFTAFDAEE
jgi:hypothetical protein